jgi:hypothetical protein
MSPHAGDIVGCSDSVMVSSSGMPRPPWLRYTTGDVFAGGFIKREQFLLTTSLLEVTTFSRVERGQYECSRGLYAALALDDHGNGLCRDVVDAGGKKLERR